MKRCWVHIGMHKTGSSSVQQNLAAVGNPAGWRLLCVGGRPNMGPPLHAMFDRNPLKCHWLAKPGNSAEEIAEKGAAWLLELRKAIEDLKEENCIISAEGLSLFSREGVVKLRDFLNPLFDEIRVIGYVRPPVGFKISRFQEYVKHGNNRFNVATIKPGYRAKFKKFDDVFGRSNVILRKFDPPGFPNQCIVADFVQQTGISLPGDFTITRVNEGLSREACGILYAYRKFGPGYGIGRTVIKENLRLIRPLLAMGGAKFKVSRGIIDPALALERKDIEWMEKRLGVSLDETGADDGTGITSEADLLTIRRSSCEEFARHFEKIYGIAIPPELIPAGDPADPAEVAALVEHCREICRQILQKKFRIKRQPSGGKGIIGMLRTTIRKIPRMLPGYRPALPAGEHGQQNEKATTPVPREVAAPAPVQRQENAQPATPAAPKAAGFITLGMDLPPDEIRRSLGKTDSSPGVKFVHVLHGPDEPQDSNLIAMARTNPVARQCLIELAKEGYHAYVVKEGATRFVRSDHIPHLWIKVRDKEYQMTPDGVVYTYTPPAERPARRLLVVLSSIAGNVNSPSLQRYFMENFPSIQKYMPSDTAVLRIGDIGGVMWSFYLNTRSRPDNVTAVQNLMESVRREHGFDHDAVVLYGVSKGATGALYHGLLGGYRFVAVDPIIADEHYVRNLRDAHFTVGGVFPETKEEVFAKLFHRMESEPAAPCSSTRSAVICSERSPQFAYISKSMIGKFGDRMAFFNALDPAIMDHPDVGPKTVNCATMLMNMQLYGLDLRPGVTNLG